MPGHRPEGDPRHTPALRPAILDENPATTRRAREVSTSRPRLAAVGFQDPDFGGPVDLRGHLALLPPNAATKGMFVVDLLGAVSKLLTPPEVRMLAGVPDRRVFPFSDYPMSEYMKMEVVVAGALFRDVPLGEGLRRIGHRTFETLLGSQIGKTLFGVQGRDFERIIVLAGRAYDLTLNFGALGVEKTGPGCFTLRASGIPMFLETHHVGVFEGMLDYCGAKGRVRVAADGLADASFEIELD